MDPGEPVYQRFLLDQAKRHIEAFPESAGICIDRMDWTRLYNTRRDDGVSWFRGGPARSLVVSWHAMLGKLAPLMHRAGKVIYCNPHYRRVDLLARVDGIYDEFGQFGHSLNLCALLGLHKPVMEWTVDIDALREDSDAYFQRHLHMGVFPTVPLPGNDHCIQPAKWVERCYFDYGPLLDALRGKRWVLRAHVIEVAGGRARANIFSIPGGYTVPVTFGGKAERVRVVLRGLALLSGQKGFRAEAILPGGGRVPVEVRGGGEERMVDVPLRRGAAVLKLAHAWIEPEARYLFAPIRLMMGSMFEGAEIRYTLDGSEPGTASPLYAHPVPLEKAATVTMAVYVRGRRVAPILRARFVKLPPQAPEIVPPGDVFEDVLWVRLAAPPPFSIDRIRLTLDGSEPSSTSPTYGGPIRLAESATIKARILAPGCERGSVRTARFRKVPPAPPSPDVRLDERKPLRATVGWGGAPRVNRSIQEKPLSVAGRRYGRGMGVHAPSELAYALEPVYGRFVATVGVDDEVKAYPQASVVFRVVVEGKLLYETPVLRRNERWHLDVRIPPGSRRIRLLVGDAGDGRDCDHADWVDAGFIVETRSP